MEQENTIKIAKSAHGETFLGKIPAKIRAWTVSDQTFGWHWDHAGLFNKGHMLKCKHASMADPSNSGACKTAKAAHEKFLKYTKNHGKTEEVEMDNVPLSGLTIIGTRRGAADRIDFLVRLPNDMVTAVRHDFLMDVITYEGLNKNVLPGEYIFGHVDGTLELVRIGSFLHQKLLEADARFKLERITELKLVPGRLYRNRSGEISLFLGFANTLNLSLKKSQIQKELDETHRLKSLIPDDVLQSIPRLEFSKTKWEMATIWLDSIEWLISIHKTKEAIESKVAESVQAGTYSLSILKTHTFKEEVPDVQFDLNFDVFQSVRTAALDSFKKEVSIHSNDYTWAIESKFDYEVYYTNVGKKNAAVVPELHNKVKEQATYIDRYNKNEKLFSMAKPFIPRMSCVPWGMQPELDTTLDELVSSLKQGILPSEYCKKRSY